MEPVARAGALKLVAYRGGSILGGDTSSLKLSYGRCYVGVAKPEQWPVTLDAQLTWASHTRRAEPLAPRQRDAPRARAVHDRPREHPPEDGRMVEDWCKLYMYALGVLPMFDPAAIPDHLIVDKKGRCFLVRALAHPDDRIARAARTRCSA